MKLQTRLIIDTSSLAKRCYFAGKDTEHGFEVVFEEKKVFVNGWQHGFESFLNSVSSTFRDTDTTPRDMLLVLEGSGGSTMRRNIYPGYKQRDPRPPEVLEQYSRMEQEIVSFFKGLGAITVKQDGVEADDVVKYLSSRLDSTPRVVVMDDGDGVIMNDPENGCQVRYQSKMVQPGENPLGPWPVALNRLYKATVGDKSDTIKGAPGFGEAAWATLYGMAGEEGMFELCRIIEEGTWHEIEEEAKSCKPLKLILDNTDTVRRCYKVAGFFDHLVNTPGHELVWEAGMPLEKPEGSVPDKRFDHWYQERKLVTSNNFAEWMASSIWAHIRSSPYVSLDLETSTPEKSDEWLRMINDLDEDDEVKGVDVIASKISGLGLTYGDNQQRTIYLSVDHKTDKNITPEQLYQFLRKLLSEDPDIRINVHNSAFELPVLFLNLCEWTAEDPVFDEGFLPRVDDTLFQAAYVNENERSGLKARAESVLGYTQQTYEQVVTCPETGRKRKMNELTPREVFSYGTDDTIVTSALRNIFEIQMQLESTWDVYRTVELDASYLVAAGMVTGTAFDREEMRRQEKLDDALYDKAWAKVRQYLVNAKWEGVEMPAVTLEPASMKEVFKIVTGQDLETKARTPAKLAILMGEVDGAETLADLYAAACKTGDMSSVEAYARKFFKGEPTLNVDSPTQMVKLLYEVMGLPIRVRNKPTAAAKEQFGRHAEGTPTANALAMASAKFYDSETHPEAVEILNSLIDMRSVATRRKMFYKPYRYLRHWQTGNIHGSFGQNMTVTGRFAPSKPNLAQLPKDKGDFRACFIPHHKRAVIVSLDFKAQELRVIAEQSGDEAMISCFVGDNRRDMHHLTGLKIAQNKVNSDLTYDEFSAAIALNDPVLVPIRKKGKTTNFATEYGAQAPKLAETLMVPVEEAQIYLDARTATFWRAEEWKQEEVIPTAKKQGYFTTMLGRRRHLAAGFASDNWGDRSRAERQAVNFAIQGSCGEMTKIVMGKVWRKKLLIRFDAQFFAAIHDEVVFSVGIDDLVPFVQELHSLMIGQYADMKIPLESSIGIGLNFKHLIEIGELPTVEKIVGAAKELFPDYVYDGRVYEPA